MAFPLCTVGSIDPAPKPAGGARRHSACGSPPTRDAIYVRAGVIGGRRTVRISAGRTAGRDERPGHRIGGRFPACERRGTASSFRLDATSRSSCVATLPSGHRAMSASCSSTGSQVTTVDQLFIFLPLLMWVAAALVSWLLVPRLLIRPLRRLQRAVVEYPARRRTRACFRPDLAPATEIQELGDAFAPGGRPDRESRNARRSRRWKASGGWSARSTTGSRTTSRSSPRCSASTAGARHDPKRKAAYSAIGRRVDALSVVHRNHYAEMEENRGIALRPLLTELAAGLRVERAARSAQHASSSSISTRPTRPRTWRWRPLS